MDKYIKLYRKLSPDDKEWANSRSYRKNAPKMFKGKELKTILKYADANIKECGIKRKGARKELLDLVLKEEKHNFKSHCVNCGRMIVPIDSPRKPKEYEARGNFCDYCHRKGNKWAKKSFYKDTIRILLGATKEGKSPKPILTREDFTKGRKMIKLK